MMLKTPPEIGGMGHSVKRKEDARFIRGKGTYVDDVQLPGMVYMDIVRSPYAHATILSINTKKALAIPGVLAVITGETLAKYKLHWMPTLMSDTQMVLPVDKVMYQSQEVAAVIATDRYIAADGVAAVEVDYKPLPVVVDPRKALAPDAPVLRTDKPHKKDNHIFHWEVGDRAATDRAFREAEVTVKQDMYLPRIHVASIETCGCVAQYDKVSGKLTVWMTTQAPHAIRTVFSLVSGIPETKIRVRYLRALENEEWEILPGGAYTRTMFLDITERVLMEREKARLEAQPWIRQARVTRLLPSTLQVVIEERVPFAVWQSKGKTYVVDREGAVLAPVVREAYADLPLVVGEGAGKNAADLFAELAFFEGLKKEVIAAIRVGDRRWTLKLASGADVMLPDDNIADALKTLVGLDEERGLLHRQIAAVDLRLADRVGVKLRENTTPAPAPDASGLTEVPTASTKGNI